MKHIEVYLKGIIVGIIIWATASGSKVFAQGETFKAEDAVTVSLLTCAPHQEIYSLYGHTAIRYKNIKTGEDWAFNYGVFNFNKPFFIIRFTLGKTDYELGVVPFSIFKKEYRKYGSQVIEQVLNLTAEEKEFLYNALKHNCLPENRTYRYNFLYYNCTTRARDIIEKCVNGRIIYADNSYLTTYRDIIHSFTKRHPWAAFGNDLCLGMKADNKTTQREQQFIPEFLMHDFDRAQIYTTEGAYRPLVKERNIVVMPGVQTINRDFPLTPLQIATAMLAITFSVTLMEYRRKRTFKIFDITLMMLQGLAGIVMTLLFFSEHPTTSANLQLLLLNPMPLFFIPSVIKGEKNTYWTITIVLATIFLIGATFQDYAEGMELLAIILMTRCIIHRYMTYETKKKK